MALGVRVELFRGAAAQGSCIQFVETLTVVGNGSTHTVHVRIEFGGTRTVHVRIGGTHTVHVRIKPRASACGGASGHCDLRWQGPLIATVHCIRAAEPGV